jgi:hypothetical protein
MKRKYLIIGSLAFAQFFAKAQSGEIADSIRVKKTEIEMVYNHYLQKGSNSAVTGGIGTERLTVYGPALALRNVSGKNAFSLEMGADVISSASTDNIDFVVSSASVRDIRAYMNSSYSRQLEKQRLQLNAGFGLSVESDYLSLSGSLGIIRKNKNLQRTLTANIQFYKDDLRWGRLNPDYYRPVGLIYPSELRYKAWFDVYTRYSYNLKSGITQIMNKRNTLGIFPEFSYQQGLLSTPFHRVYFNNDSLAVEKLPATRLKGAIALKLYSFVGGRVVLKNAIHGYTDNFGIHSMAFENETAIKLRPYLTLLPNIRIYSQKSSSYFARYREHHFDSDFYTSDYDLSSFRTYNAGIGIRYNPQKYLRRNFVFNSIVFRYSYMHRTTSLNAHIFSLVLQTTAFRKKK